MTPANSRGGCVKNISFLKTWGSDHHTFIHALKMGGRREKENSWWTHHLSL